MSSKDFRFGISSSVQGVDLNQLLVAHSLSTYFMRVANDMPELGLSSGDILVVDRALNPRLNDMVIIAEDGDPELKVIRFQKDLVDFQLWGVAVHAIRSLRP